MNVIESVCNRHSAKLLARIEGMELPRHIEDHIKDVVRQEFRWCREDLCQRVESEEVEG